MVWNETAYKKVFKKSITLTWFLSHSSIEGWEGVGPFMAGTVNSLVPPLVFIALFWYISLEWLMSYSCDWLETAWTIFGFRGSQHYFSLERLHINLTPLCFRSTLCAFGMCSILLLKDPIRGQNIGQKDDGRGW